jgi:uncharacterized protein (UPF0335 family)
MTRKGHNGPPRGVDVTAAQLAAVVERAERVIEERAALAADLAEIYAEARGEGYDVPTIKRVVQRRKKAEADVVEADELLRVYEDAILRAGSLAHVHEAA